MPEYSKPYLSPNDLVNNHLPAKGINYTKTFDQQKAEELLSKINWYRFKSYLHPFLQSNSKLYISGTTFEQGVDLYYFDCELRELCNKYILRIEVKVRTIIDQTITAFTKDPFWYLNDDLFSNPDDLYSERKKIINSLKYSKLEFAEYYKLNYTSPKEAWRSAPPFWLASELISFDTLNKFIQQLNSQKFMRNGNNELGFAANKLNAISFKELKSWLSALKELRNKASHSARTWNSNYRIPSGFVNNDNKLLTNSYIKLPPSKKNRIYTILVTLKLITNKLIHPKNDFSTDLMALIKQYNHLNYLEDGMGFPANWQSDPVWN